jgi:hypothetical protein
MRGALLAASVAGALTVAAPVLAQEPTPPAPAPSPPPSPPAPASPTEPPVPPGYIVIEAEPPPPVVVGSPPPPAEAPLPKPAYRSRFTPAVEGGYNYQNIFGIPINGFDIQATIGADARTPSLNLRAGVALGAAFAETEDGLRTTTTGIGPFIEWHAGRFRLGGGARVGTFTFTRATNGASVFNMSAGLFLRSSLDLIRLDKEGDTAIYLVVRGSLDTVGASLYGFNAGLGVRF